MKEKIFRHEVANSNREIITLPPEQVQDLEMLINFAYRNYPSIDQADLFLFNHPSSMWGEDYEEGEDDIEDRDKEFVGRATEELEALLTQIRGKNIDAMSDDLLTKALGL